MTTVQWTTVLSADSQHTANLQLKDPKHLADHPDSAEEAKRLLKDIRDKELRVVEDKFERRQNRTQSFHDYIQRQLDHPAQVLPELIQNADDVEPCDTVQIELTDDMLRIRNNGRPMKTEEVDTLCAAGESTKHDPEYIGHFGLGFKSVFSISENPRIRSGYFNFEFDAEQLTVPRILDGAEPINGTEIELPLKDDLSSKKHDELQNRLDEVYRLLTYLRNISQIEVTQGNSTTVYHRESESDSPERIIYKDDSIFERRLVFRTDDTPSGEAFEQLAEVRQIDDIETIRESPVSVTVSFEVDDQHRPLSEAEECYLFNFLPTDERSGFPFDIHADFLLEPSRKALAWRDGAYNQWLLYRVGDTFRKIVEHYRDLNAERVGHLQLLPSQKYGLDHTSAAKDAVVEALNDEDSIPGQDGGYHRPGAIVVPTYHVENVFTKSDVKHLLGRAVEYPAESMDESLLSTLRGRSIIEEVSVESLLKQSEDSAREDFSRASTAHLLVFAAALWEYWDDEYRNLSTFSDKTDARNDFESVVKKTPLVPLESGKRIAVSLVEDSPLLPPKRGREEYDIFEDEFRLVQLDVASIPEEYPAKPSGIIEGARKFYSRVLGVETISSEIVLEEIVADAFDSVESTDDATLDTHLEYIFSNKNRWATARKYVDLKFRVRDGADDTVYRNPSRSDIFLPDGYFREQGTSSDGGYSLERVLDGLDATFISEEYVSLTGESQPERWKKFLIKCGVFERLPVKELATRDRAFYTLKEELVESLSDFAQASTKEDWSIPDSRKKGGSKDQWFPQNRRYSLSDYVPCDWFRDVLNQFSENTDSELDRAKAFDQMLQEYWGYYEEKLHRPLYYVTKRGRGGAYRAKPTQTDRYSTFGDLLRNTSWCLTKDETLAPPRTLLVENPATANQPPQMYIASTDSPYLDPLGVKTKLGIEVTLEQLSNAPSVWGDADPPTIRQELTSRLDTLQQGLLDDGSDIEEKIHEALSNARFIYLEHKNPQFRSPDEVVWNGQDIGSYIVSIESEYGKYEELFNTVGVRSSLQILDYLDSLADVAWDDDDDRDVVWRRTVRKLVSEVSELTSFQELEAEVREKLSHQCLLALSNELVALNQLDYFCDDETIREHLRSDIADEVVKPYDRRDYTNETVAEVWKLLELENLADTTTLSLTGHNVVVSEEGPVCESEEFSQLFTVAYSFCLAHGHTEAGDELLDIFADSQVVVHETIECQYLSTKGEPITEEFEVRCYLDRSEDTIRRTEGTSSLQAFTRRLPYELSLSASAAEELESILSGALGKRERFLNSFLDTFDIDRHSIQAAVQSSSRSEKDSAETAEESTVSESKTDSGTGSDDSGEGGYPAGATSEDSDEKPLITTSSEEEGFATAGDASENGVGRKNQSASADTGSSLLSGSSQDTSSEDPNSASTDKRKDEARDQQSIENESEPSDVDDLPERVSRRRTSTTRTVRDGEFMKKVRSAYDRTCAICGARRETKDGLPEVEAHHIRPVSDGGPDTLQNGIALCRLHHWAFEKGWIAVSDDYEILVRDWESVPGYGEFSRHHEESLHLPDNPQHYPNSQYLKYHRQSHGLEE